MRPGRPATGTPFRHVGLLYRGRADYAVRTVAFVRDGVGRGEPVLVAVPGPHLGVVRTALGAATGRVRFVDMAVTGRNPGRIIPEILWAFLAAHPGERVRMIGEPVWPGRGEIAYPACAAHEAAINAVFAGSDASILCPYDAAALDATVVADVARTHPLLSDGAGVTPSRQYPGAVAAAALFNRPLPAPPDTARTLAYAGEGSLHQVRRLVTDVAGAAGLSPHRVADLVLAVNELATNTCVHTSLPGRLSVWTEAAAVVCQVEDHGVIHDPVAGRLPPDPASPHGRGLLLVHLMCDLVRVHTTARSTTVRVQMDR